MTSRSQERRTFNTYRAAMIKELTRDATDEKQLNDIGKREFGKFWGGVHPVDRIKIKPNKYYIVNVDTHEKPGSHWTALKTTKKHGYIWDSYGRSPGRIVPHLIENLHEHGYGIGKTDLTHYKAQIGYSSSVCGQDSLGFLLTARDLGIAKARNI